MYNNKSENVYKKIYKKTKSFICFRRNKDGTGKDC